MESTSPIRIVLQGEVAVIKRNVDHFHLIKTTVPVSCNILTLYDEQKEIGILAHIDDYSCVVDSIKRIQTILLDKYNVKMKKCTFVAKVFGGSSEFHSIKQRELILLALKISQICFEILPLAKLASQRPQTLFNLQNGDVTFLYDKQINKRLEHLQKREYGDWNDILDYSYGNLPGDKIPYFKIKEANRFEFNIPSFEMTTVENALQLEKSGLIKFPLQANRQVAQDKKEVVENLKTIVLMHASNSTALKNSLLKQDFNALLRQASANPTHIKVLENLLENQLMLEIDTCARGSTSGTAMDVALKFQNQEAIDLLKRVNSVI